MYCYELLDIYRKGKLTFGIKKDKRINYIKKAMLNIENAAFCNTLTS